ncbi:VOC family protein [Aquirufa nivalisilvae]|uniref:VOC family protein n=1 Tax=Aquirufa nivalisilvae TaxID=2516557 RepID=UPI001032EE1A|nr:VOC family protein [Aquirufa nivalisilvae]MCZ2479684.1 VOC family protein [Aquirufa nivalisilvae]MCZ2481680.1 VOC family protein [Aquirufa nivalisilvae]TBH76237.1 VOC family protein [Aquirufa nivalisilvae]
MRSSIQTCLWFNQTAKEAREFYQSIFEDFEVKSENPMVSSVRLNGRDFIFLGGANHVTFNPSISFFLIFQSNEALEKKWADLSKDGKVLMELNTYPWSSLYGWCEDKNGISWQLMIQLPLPEKIIPALLFTQQNNGKAEQAIQYYTHLIPHSQINLLDRYKEGSVDKEGNIQHAQFLLNDQHFIAFESSYMHQFIFNDAISFVITCQNQDEIDFYWDSFIRDGGSPSKCGWIKDPFGVSWQIIPENMGQLMRNFNNPTFMNVFMSMGKIDINALENALNG